MPSRSGNHPGSDSHLGDFHRLQSAGVARRGGGHPGRVSALLHHDLSWPPANWLVCGTTRASPGLPAGRACLAVVALLVVARDYHRTGSPCGSIGSLSSWRPLPPVLLVRFKVDALYIVLGAGMAGYLLGR